MDQEKVSPRVWNGSRRVLICVVVLLAVAGLATIKLHARLPLVILAKQDPQLVPPYLLAVDSKAYLSIAEGHISDVPSPFSKRALYPVMAAGLAQATHLPLASAFLTLNYGAFILFCFCLAAVLPKIGVSPWWALLFVLTPLPLESLLLGYLSDQLHAAIIALFFLLLLSGRERWSLVALLAAFLVRESTLLVCLVVCAVGLMQKNKVLARGGLLVLVLGMAAGAWLAKLGQPNVHRLPDLVYLPLKVIYNFIYVVCGLQITSNVKPEEVTPFVRFHLPSFLRFGADTEVGLCYHWYLPIQTAVYMLTLFGCAPLVVKRMWKRVPPQKSWPVAVQIAFWYGLIAYLFGPTLGAWTSRLVLYGWPLFWIALPYMVRQSGLPLQAKDMAILAGGFVAAAWLPNLAGFPNPGKSLWLWAYWVPAIPVIYYVVRARLLAVEQRRPVTA